MNYAELSDILMKMAQEVQNLYWKLEPDVRRNTLGAALVKAEGELESAAEEAILT